MTLRNYIAGKWVSSETTFSSVNPHDGSLVALAVQSSPRDVNHAVAAAREAFPGWSSLPASDRAVFLRKVADYLAEEYGEAGQPTRLKEAIVNEMGKRLPEADIEVLESSDMIRFFADAGPGSLADVPITLNAALWPSKASSIAFMPVGVVAAIKPWNYPLELPLWSVGAALIAGNTVVFKPSEHTPFVATLLVELFERAGLPPGVLNLVTGNGAAGAALAGHPGVDMVSFTGSIPVGREVSIKCAERLCRVTLELGGKDAMVVLPDADLDLAVKGALWGAFTNCGQVCVGVRRLLLPESLRKQFLEPLIESTNALVLGRDVGPLVSRAQRERVERHVADAVSKGARVLCGGQRPSGDEYKDGFYYLPTILENVSAGMLVEEEDTFGPVLTVRTYGDEKEALVIVDDAGFDLGASVWTTDLDRGRALARRMRVGMVWVNDVNVAFPEAPWCGHRKSGHGVELSTFAIREYSALKHISCETGRESRRPWWFPYS